MSRNWLMLAGVVGLVAVCSSSPYGDEPAATQGTSAASSNTAGTAIDNKLRVPVEVARDRAQLMHQIYTATLDTIHHRYFHRETAVIPARAMEDIFIDMKRQSQVDARWIAVNLRAMSIDHEPETDFEKFAAREISSGKTEVERIEAGYLRRATAIPLVDGCVACHEGTFRQPTKNPKFAGLVISIPITSVPAQPAPAAPAPVKQGGTPE